MAHEAKSAAARKYDRRAHVDGCEYTARGDRGEHITLSRCEGGYYVTILTADKSDVVCSGFVRGLNDAKLWAERQMVKFAALIAA